MATLNLKSIKTLVSNQAAAVQASASALVDFSVGSISLAFAEANAAVAMWLQGLILVVLQVSRLATSTGSDVDSFVNDFGVTRLVSSSSIGTVTFSRYTSTASALVPVGAQVQSADGTQVFSVTAATSNSYYSANLGGYLIPATIPSISVPVQAVSNGAASNVVAGGINRMTTAISGIDYVNNAAAMTGGANAESDAALKARFVLFIASLRAGTVASLLYSVTSSQLGIQATVTENQTTGGFASNGFVYLTVDDGTGNPSSTTVTNAYIAANAVRAAGIQLAVIGPTVVTANVSMTITTATGYNHTTVVGIVAAALTQYISGLGLGNGLSFIKLGQVAFNASPGVTDVQYLTLNGATADIYANNQVTIKPGTISVS